MSLFARRRRPRAEIEQELRAMSIAAGKVLSLDVKGRLVLRHTALHEGINVLLTEWERSSD